jgi:two-component system cell cycle response regulator DivK
LKKRLAFVVEDDPDLSYIFASAVQAAGFDTEIINSGARALARLAEVTPSLVLLDLHLPHFSGVNVLRQIQSDTRLLNTRVIVATADSIQADELRDKADLVLIKPVTFSQIRDFVLRLFPPASGSPAPDEPPKAEPPTIELPKT